MSEKTYRASNGYEVAEEGGELIVHDKYGVFYTNITETLGDALRGYFQHERDQQLGRTRWPENPDYVIYRDESEDGHGRSVRVVDEQAGRSWRVWENSQSCVPLTYNHRYAADWFFTEGPGKPERPWEQAEPGEVWRLTVDGLEGNHVKKLTTFSGGAYKVTPDYTGITAGRKLLEADGSLADDEG